jgi:hypothetical protein
MATIRSWRRATLADETTPSPVDALTALHELVRRLLTTVMGYTDTSFFRPAGQRAPVGSTDKPYATVKLYAEELLSFNLRRFEVTDSAVTVPVEKLGNPTSDLIEVIDSLDTVTASVQFFKDGRVDAVGRAAWGEAALSRAHALVRRLELTQSVEAANALGLAYQGTLGPVRDLSDVKVDGVGERRAQVDLVFCFSDSEAAAQAMFRSVSFLVKVQQPDGYINEVSS